MKLPNLKLPNYFAISILFLFSFNFGINAQVQGVIMYKYRAEDVELDIKDPVEREQVMSIINKNNSKNFKLQFNGKYSLFQEIKGPSIENEISSFDVQGVEGIIFIDKSDNTYINELEFFGKRFLVKDSLDTLNWTLQDEQKLIGKYTSYKAIYRKPYFSTDPNKSEVKFQTIEAWYCPRIPINLGPWFYNGLPGLILELKIGDEIIIAEQISISRDSSEKLIIKRPDKGQKVNKTEFDSIKQFKLNELKEHYKKRP